MLVNRHSYAELLKGVVLLDPLWKECQFTLVREEAEKAKEKEVIYAEASYRDGPE
jgi:hypothetical protein